MSRMQILKSSRFGEREREVNLIEGLGIMRFSGTRGSEDSRKMRRPRRPRSNPKYPIRCQDGDYFLAREKCA